MSEFQATPYANDPEHLADEAAFVAARCRRIAFEREIADKPMGSFGPAEADDPGGTPEQKRKLAVLQAAEDARRARIDARLARNRQEGPELGLDRLVARHGLDEAERVILVLCSMSCISIQAAEPMAACSGFSFAVASPTVETIAVFLGLDVAGCIGLRRVLGDDGKLVRAGLVIVEMGKSDLPHSFPSAGVMLTTAAFQVIAGLDDTVDNSRCPSCGQAVAS